MKKTFALLSLTLLLAACQNYTVATPEELKAYPESQPIIETWQSMVDAGSDENCQPILDHMRKSLKVTEEDCPKIFAYFKEAPTIDWSRTDWNASSGKAKIYAEGGASVTSFILDTRDNIWRADEKFWE